MVVLLCFRKYGCHLLMSEKQAVEDFWNEASCGEALYLNDSRYDLQAEQRYRLEPHILTFADFPRWKGKRVLEIGVGLGADHEQFSRAGAILAGIDLTARAIEHTRRRLQGKDTDLRVADAESLPFEDNSFDLVYSFGVIHHSPDTAQCAREILRVLKPGGEFRVMIYQRHSLVGLMLWLRYGTFRRSLDEVYSRYLESPGTKTYSPQQARQLFAGAQNIKTASVLTHADLLSSGAGQRHEGALLRCVRAIWPRWLLKRIAEPYGLHLLISGIK
jgi:ubiquinone/menaquinone biosynthesis C-methylase UbiE